MNIKEIKKEALLARICATRQIMGEDAAQAAAESINQHQRQLSKQQC